jgi:hypothetical protein
VKSAVQLHPSNGATQAVWPDVRTIRLAHDLLLDVDEKSQISGLWMLNVPPRPAGIELE